MSMHPVIFRNYVNGEFVDSGQYIDDFSPVDGALVGRIAVADQALVKQATSAARTALSGPWANLTVNERANTLHRIADLIEARQDEFVAAEIADTGKPLQQASTLDIPRGAANFRAFADLIKNQSFEGFNTELPDGTRALNYSVRKPVGVVAVIAPWNLPLLLLTWKLAPALAMGNTIVAKPSEETPATASLLAEVFAAAEVPPGVFNLVHGLGPNAAGEWLTRDADVDAITFTGESKTGAAIMQASANGVKKLSFELGGKNAAVVFADADFDAAVQGVARAVFTNCGQVCLCAERVYVHRSLFERFVAGLKQEAEALVIGHPLQTDTQMGPLISRQHREKVLQYFSYAQEDGAQFITGGGVPEFGNELDQGAYIQPTIISGLSEDSRCIREEIFGPVCHVTPFSDEDEVLAMVNDSEYGLACSLWTENLQRVHRLAPRIEAGVVWVNCWFLRDLRTPFGGVKLSGIGREGGQHSLAFYSELSNVCIKVE